MEGSCENKKIISSEILYFSFSLSEVAAIHCWKLKSAKHGKAEEVKFSLWWNALEQISRADFELSS